MMPDFVDRTLALRWLVSARRATFAAQFALMIFAEAGTEIHLHSPELVTILLAWVVWDLLQAILFRRKPAPQHLFVVSAIIDLAALTAMLALSGGKHSPLLFGYLAYLALLAMVLPAAQAWAAAVYAMILQAVVVLHPAQSAGLPVDVDTPTHLAGHVVTFDLSAAAITWVVTRLSAALRARSALDREAERKREVTDRLAALGTLAAGVAHELGTPLAAIQLLAEQAQRRAPDTAPDSPLTILLEQVARCRSILDRLRGRADSDGADCRLDLDRWIAEWRRGAPEVEVDLPPQISGGRVAGSEASWRAALWVALDNARRAGARRVHLGVSDSAGMVALAVEDDGRGLDSEAARRAGEPFWSGWGGTGLGLFVARSFAQSVGGDVIVEAAAGTGARIRILIPRVPG